VLCEQCLDNEVAASCSKWRGGHRKVHSPCRYPYECCNPNKPRNYGYLERGLPAARARELQMPTYMPDGVLQMEQHSPPPKIYPRSPPVSRSRTPSPTRPGTGQPEVSPRLDPALELLDDVNKYFKQLTERRRNLEETQEQLKELTVTGQKPVTSREPSPSVSPQPPNADSTFVGTPTNPPGSYADSLSNTNRSGSPSNTNRSGLTFSEKFCPGSEYFFSLKPVASGPAAYSYSKSADVIQAVAQASDCCRPVSDSGLDRLQRRVSFDDLKWCSREDSNAWSAVANTSDSPAACEFSGSARPSSSRSMQSYSRSMQPSRGREGAAGLTGEPEWLDSYGHELSQPASTVKIFQSRKQSSAPVVRVPSAPARGSRRVFLSPSARAYYTVQRGDNPALEVAGHSVPIRQVRMVSEGPVAATSNSTQLRMAASRKLQGSNSYLVDYSDNQFSRAPRKLFKVFSQNGQ
jgi:hypothetical protein